SYEGLTAALGHATAEVKGSLAAATGTTQISVVDAGGFMVSMTTTNGAGGGVLIPGTGIHLNNMLGEDDLLPDGLDAVTPGERLRSMSAPTILLAPDGTATALGSGGSARIRSAIATVIVRLRDGGESLPEAIAAPRAHLEDSGVVQVEHGLSAESLAQLRQHFDVNVWDCTDFYFGGVNAVQRTPDGQVTAVADHRRNGSVAIVPAAG
ncbi:MAG: gamma-glutamyltranspeptidase / glutathione hydrolase, partial [Actinomycetota bacterium]|nr:gamma-glutamyltranspeptidase / glutathione hydrolase [Actinomycetota bacterium]